MTDAREMPRYVSHKKVWALEIATINRETPGKIILSFVDKGYAPLTFDEADPIFVRYIPLQRDFYVVYEDGYKSLSPRKAFLEGYTAEGQSFADIKAGINKRDLPAGSGG